MQTPTIHKVLNPDTPGRRTGARIALLFSMRKFLRDIPVKPNQEDK